MPTNRSRRFSMVLRAAGRSCRGLVPVVAAAATLAVSAGVSAAPQASTARQDVPAQERGTMHVVTADNVSVRAGRSSTYYPFARLKQGDLVWVNGTYDDYRSVRIAGHAFKDAWGFIKDVAGASSRFTADAAGERGVTAREMQVYAPNLYSDSNPDDSWKGVFKVPANTELRILKATKMRDLTVYRVPMPPRAVGWVSSRFLREATAAEIDAWTLAHAPKTTANAKPEMVAKADDAAGSKTDTTTQTNAGAQPVARDEPVLLPPRTRDLPTNTGAARNTEAATKTNDDPAMTDSAASNDATNAEAASRNADTPALEGPKTGDEAPVTPAVEEKPEEPAKPTPRARLNDLEVAFRALQKEAIETAEVEPLRQQYLALMEELGDDYPRAARHAALRADQLEIWRELQKRKSELAALRRRMDVTTDEAAAARLAAATTGGYVAVGRLAASTIFEGTHLPRLLRLQDVTSGRTIAYLRPGDEQSGDEINLTSMLGRVIGVVGDRRFDEGLRLNLIDPRRVDLLAPEQRETVKKAG